MTTKFNTIATSRNKNGFEKHCYVTESVVDVDIVECKGLEFGYLPVGLGRNKKGWKETSFSMDIEDYRKYYNTTDSEVSVRLAL